MPKRKRLCKKTRTKQEKEFSCAETDTNIEHPPKVLHSTTWINRVIEIEWIGIVNSFKKDAANGAGKYMILYGDLDTESMDEVELKSRLMDRNWLRENEGKRYLNQFVSNKFLYKIVEEDETDYRCVSVSGLKIDTRWFNKEKVKSRSVVVPYPLK